MKKQVLLAAGLLPAVTGCASIVRGGSQEITINSTPDQAAFEIRDNKGGTTPITGVTPGKVTLKKGAGYFKGGSYTVTLSKPGYVPSNVHLDSSVSGWYMGGNLLVGGLIGYLAVDPATGAMWKLQPENVQVALTSLTASEANPPLLAAAEPPAPIPVPAAKPEAAPAPGDTTEPQHGAPAVTAPAPQAVVPAPVATPKGSGLSAGSHPLAHPAVLLRQPRTGATIDASIPAGATVELKQRLPNAGGVWWFVNYNGSTGWLSDSALVQ